MLGQLVSRRRLSHNRDRSNCCRDGVHPYPNRASQDRFLDTARDLAGHGRPPCRTDRVRALVNGDCGYDCGFEAVRLFLLEQQAHNRRVLGRRRAKRLEDRLLLAPVCLDRLVRNGHQRGDDCREVDRSASFAH